jgi:hypothetical protein
VDADLAACREELEAQRVRTLTPAEADAEVVDELFATAGAGACSDSKRLLRRSW